MTPQGGGWYELTLWAENLTGAQEQAGEAWVAIQFVANGENGQVLARSKIFRKVTLGQCSTR
jgi:hypothetical protein